MKWLVFIWILSAAACTQKHQSFRSEMDWKRVDASDEKLTSANGKWLYANEPFTGEVVSYYPNGKLRFKHHYNQGIEHGYQQSWYENGQAEEQRLYVYGKKAATHLGWWSNGQPRFERHFHNDEYHGINKEWYANGKPYTMIGYLHNLEIAGAGWRESGKLFMNFKIKNGVRYGLVNAELCYTVSNNNNSTTKNN